MKEQVCKRNASGRKFLYAFASLVIITARIFSCWKAACGCSCRSQCLSNG